MYRKKFKNSKNLKKAYQKFCRKHKFKCFKIIIMKLLPAFKWKGHDSSFSSWIIANDMVYEYDIGSIIS